MVEHLQPVAPAGLGNARCAEDIERIQGNDLCELLKIGVVECEEPWHLVLDQHCNQASVAARACREFRTWRRGPPTSDKPAPFPTENETLPARWQVPCVPLRASSQARLRLAAVCIPHIPRTGSVAQSRNARRCGPEHHDGVPRRLPVGMVRLGECRRMLESTRIIHRPWVDALAAIVRTASASLMAIHPRAKGFQPRIPRAPIAFVQDHDPDPPPLKILSSGHVFPLPLDDLSHHSLHCGPGTNRLSRTFR